MAKKSHPIRMSKNEAEVCCYIKCMYCGEVISATFDDSSIEEITPAGHNCKGVIIDGRFK